MPKSRGQPRRFVTEDDFITAMTNYLAQGDAFPNLAGFCVFARLNMDTYYEYKLHYPEAFNIVEMMLESAILNIDPKMAGRVPFYLKNKFKYKDVQEQTITVPDPIQINYGKLGTEDLLKLKEIAERAKDDHTKD